MLLLKCLQIKAGLDRLMDIIKDEITEDPKLTPHVSPTAVTYFDVMPEMIGYVLGSRCGRNIQQMMDQPTQVVFPVQVPCN
jgi:hypothetical protein